MSHELIDQLFKNSLPMCRVFEVFPVLSQETPPSTLARMRKASFTLEASIILPLLVGFILYFLSLFRVLQVEELLQGHLSYVTRYVAVEASLGNEVFDYASAEVLLRSRLEKEELIKRYVKNGIWGFSLWGSEFDQEKVHIVANYSFQLPVSFFGFDTISCRQECQSHKWIGRNKEEEKVDQDWVYISANGTVYHLDRTCGKIKIDQIYEVSAQAVSSVRNKKEMRLKACPFCAKKQTSVLYFYTLWGEYYHSKTDCLALTRKITMVKKTEVGNRSLCFYCGQNQKEKERSE